MKVSAFTTSGYNYLLFFFFNDTATTEIYTLSLHDALPIYRAGSGAPLCRRVRGGAQRVPADRPSAATHQPGRLRGRRRPPDPPGGTGPQGTGGIRSRRPGAGGRPAGTRVRAASRRRRGGGRARPPGRLMGDGGPAGTPP